MIKRIKSCSILFWVFAFSYGQVDTKALDGYYAQMVKDWDVPSASIGIIKDGKLVFTGNYGVKEVGTNDAPDSNTLYAIASNSKAFTSALIGILVQEGKLDWDDKVKKYLPYFELYDTWVSEQITIRDLLCHRCGLGTFSGDNIWYKSNASAEQIIKGIKHVPQAYEFRAGYGYSNLMYITAGEVIKVVTGESWATNIENRFLKPLGMNRTIARVTELDHKGNYATPHARKDNKNYAIPWVSWDNVAATGGLISSVEDLAKWVTFNLDNGVIGDTEILTTETRNTVWTPHNNFNVNHADDNYEQHFSSYGLGWGLSDYHGRMKVAHTGGYDGMITAVTLVPDENLGIIVLTNGVKSPIRAATNYALDLYLGITPKDWSKELLERANNYAKNDTRIADRKAKRVGSTTPSIATEQFTGAYDAPMYGTISIEEKDSELKLVFEHSPLLTATLTHWHYNVWQIHWDHPQAWFSFGTININTDNNLNVIGFDFDVPNNDFFFEELKPLKKK